jgi:hypothetical protein
LNDRLGNRLGDDEPHELHRLSGGRCRILPVYNGIRSAPRGAAAGLGGGRQAARETLRLARERSIPVHVRLYVDLEGWIVRPEWLLGFWGVMANSEYVGMGGIYGRGAEVRVEPGSYRPREQPTTRSSGWARRISSAESRYFEQNWSDFEFLQPGGGPQADRTSCYIWSNTPRRVGELPPGAPIVPAGFSPVGPVGSTLTETVVWQYRFNCFWGANTSRGYTDLDLANERGYREMWQV